MKLQPPHCCYTENALLQCYIDGATATLMLHFTCSALLHGWSYSHHTAATLKMHSGEKLHMDATQMKSLSCRSHDKEKLNKEGGNYNKGVRGHDYAEISSYI